MSQRVSYVSISLSSGFSFQARAILICVRILLDVSISLSSGFSFQDARDDASCSRSVVSISLSSGFSFQGHRQRHPAIAFHVSISLSSGFSFQGGGSISLTTPWYCFNLVIERLLISGSGANPDAVIVEKFQSRYRAAFHFRCRVWRVFRLLVCPFQSRYRAAFHFRQPAETAHHPADSFNLVIERLFISGPFFQSPRRVSSVSISLSSGFSFQGPVPKTVNSPRVRSFNLVIERLLISGEQTLPMKSSLGCFNLVIERLLISGPCPRSP